jgi:hypothetical protein
MRPDAGILKFPTIPCPSQAGPARAQRQVAMMITGSIWCASSALA